MNYQEWCSTKNEMGALANNVVISYAGLTGARMASVHAALLRLNPHVVANENDITLPIGKETTRLMQQLAEDLENEDIEN